MSTTLRSAARQPTRLRAWRKRQMVDDPKTLCTRPMRITDIPRLYGIPWSTWNAWELPLDDPNFRRPGPDAMARLDEITGGEIGPQDFYKRRAATAAGAGGG